MLNEIRNRLRRSLLNTSHFRRFAVAYCAHNALLPQVMTRYDSKKLREELFLPASEEGAQLNQDVFALIANRFQPGFFVEIGANDGYTLSNTLFLENQFGWTGLLVEANPSYLGRLGTRSAKVVNKAVAAQKGTVEFIAAGLYGGIASSLQSAHADKTRGAQRISVETATLDEIFMECGVPARMEFISIDVEGGEIPILEQLCASKYRFKSGCIEHGLRPGDLEAFKRMLNHSGYRDVWLSQTMQDLYFMDESWHANARHPQ